MQRKENIKPIYIERIATEFLLCYTDFSFFVNRNGWRARPDWKIVWEGNPQAFAIFSPYILAFEPSFIEIRHMETGMLVHILTAKNIRMLHSSTREVCLSPYLWSVVVRCILTPFARRFCTPTRTRWATTLLQAWTSGAGPSLQQHIDSSRTAASSVTIAERFVLLHLPSLFPLFSFRPVSKAMHRPFSASVSDGDMYRSFPSALFARFHIFPFLSLKHTALLSAAVPVVLFHARLARRPYDWRLLIRNVHMVWLWRIRCRIGRGGRAAERKMGGRKVRGCLGRGFRPGGVVGLGRWGDVDVRRYESMSGNEREPVFSDEKYSRACCYIGISDILMVRAEDCLTSSNQIRSV